MTPQKQSIRPLLTPTRKTNNMIPGDFITGLVASTIHQDDRPDYVLSLEREVARLRQGIVGDPFRGRLAYEIRIKSRDSLDMRTARRIVDEALEAALKGTTP